MSKPQRSETDFQLMPLDWCPHCNAALILDCGNCAIYECGGTQRLSVGSDSNWVCFWEMEKPCDLPA